jgi:GTPase SAR1 family protein
MGNEVSRPTGDLSPQSSGVVPPRSPYTPTGGSSRRAQSFNTRSPSPAPSPALQRRTSSSASLGVSPNSGAPNAGNPKKDRTIQRMDKAIRRRVRGGITYNMKLLIRGAKGTGKTSLFQRLKGEPIPDAHQSTPQLQSATINWSFRQHMEENVKCEVWDVVDRGFAPVETEEGAEGGSTDSQGPAGGVAATSVEHGGLQNRGGLSAKASAAAAAMQNGTHSVALVDASTVDVYHEAHGVIFLLDVTKWDTLEYVKQQLDNVPVHIPTLVLGNFRDQGAQRKIFKEDIQELLYGSSDRPQHSQWRRPMELLYFECSLLNCYGLKSLHQYFGIPFLQLKLATIRQQIRIVEGEFAHLKHDVQATISEQRYADYVEHIKSTGSDIRTGRRGNTPPTPTRKGSLQLPSRGDGDAKRGEENGDVDDDVSVVSKENGAGTPPKPAGTAATAATAAAETSQREKDVVPSQDSEDLPARNSTAVIQSAPRLMFEHKESVASIPDDAADGSAANPDDKPASGVGSGGVAASAANTNPSRPRKASVDEVVQLEDFQVPKARVSDLDHFYSEDESDEDGGDFDEDVVVAPVDGAMKTAIGGVYHKQLFLDSDSSDSDGSERALTRSKRKKNRSRKSPPRQTTSEEATAVSQASPRRPPSSSSPPSPRPPPSSSRPSQRSRPGSPARPQASSPSARDHFVEPHDPAPRQEQAPTVTPTPPAAPPTSPLASSIRHSSPRNKSENAVPVASLETPGATVRDETVGKHEPWSEEPELTGTEHALESVGLGDQEATMGCVKQGSPSGDVKDKSMEEPVDESSAPPPTTVADIDDAGPLQAALPGPDPEAPAPSYTTAFPASVGTQRSPVLNEEEAMGHYHKRNHDEPGALLSLSALQASLPLPGESVGPLSSPATPRSAGLSPAYPNGGMDSTALALSDLRPAPSSASPSKPTVPDFSTVVPSNDLEAFLNESDSDSEGAPSYAEPATATSGMRATRQDRQRMVESSDDDEDEDDDRFASYSISKQSRAERRRQRKEDLRQLNAALDSDDPFAPAASEAAADSSIGSSDVVEAIRKAQEEAMRMLPSASSPADDAEAKRHKHKHKQERKHTRREADAGSEKSSRKSSRKSGSSSRSKKRRPRVEEDLA